ncbi:MAG: carboxypeptidase-like regulatory domain-containing protein, partial [Candidatus Sulfotelmatobacter sp.]
MRALGALFLLFVFLAAASAADLKVKVVDPQSATVSGAQISLFSKGTDTPVKIVSSSAEGIATFPDVSSGNYQIQVLAPGFAPQTEDIATHSDVITIH